MSQERLLQYVCVCVFIKHNSEQELYSITGGLAKGLTSSLKTLHGLFMCRARHTYIQNLRSSLPHFCGKILTHGEWLYSLVTLYTAFCICVCHPGWVNGPHWIRGKIPWFLLLLLWRELFSVPMDWCTLIKHRPLFWRQEKDCFSI